jgi:hypothetical protein
LPGPGDNSQILLDSASGNNREQQLAASGQFFTVRLWDATPAIDG